MSDTHRALLEELAIPHRARAAFWRLMALGPAALPAVREGLRHANADVRHHCCRYLDHFVESDAFGELIAMLDDEDAQVRLHALHALACDRCKEGACRPDEAKVFPLALGLMAHDPDAHVRNIAVEIVGRAVHTNPVAVTALLDAIASDPSPAVRKKAAWFVPGGPIFKRTAPKEPRRRRAA